jgi:hypothetical protein
MDGSGRIGSANREAAQEGAAAGTNARFRAFRGRTSVEPDRPEAQAKGARRPPLSLLLLLLLSLLLLSSPVPPPLLSARQRWKTN